MATIRGGEKFEAALRDLAKKVAKPASVKIGFLAKAKYPDGTSVAMIAAIQEFGAPSIGIPPRPFFRTMIAEHQGEWPAAIADLLKSNDLDAVKTLDLAGAAIAGQLRQAISVFEGIPLKPATIKRKGFSKQLIDTGHLLASVDHEVKAE